MENKAVAPRRITMIPELHSERLLLVKLSPAFCTQQYVNWMNDPDVIRYMESGGDYTLDKLRNYLEKVQTRPEILFWAITLKASRLHIGNIKIDPVDWKNGVGEYGILLGESSQWRKGYAREATQTVIQYCFDHLRLRKIMLGVVSKNTPAIRLYERMGFVTEGICKHHRKYEGEYCDVLRMAIFNPEFTYP